MAMPYKNSKLIVIIGVSILSLSFLFFGGRSLVDIFYFLGSVLAIVVFLKIRQLKQETSETKSRISERIEEIEDRIDKLENKDQAT